MVSASGVENSFVLRKRKFNEKKLQFSEFEFILDLVFER